MENSELSIKELLEEYWRLLQSSKETDPSKNLLFLELQNKLNVSIKGYAQIAPYEARMQQTFIDFWKHHFGEQQLDDYILELQKRVEVSTDSDNLLKLEMCSLDMNVTNYALTGDIQLDGKRLGYLIAVKGDNPRISSLVHEITSYPFGIPLHVLENNDDFINENYWNQVLVSYHAIFQKLHWVTVGYSNAKKLQEIKRNFSKANEISYTPLEQMQPPIESQIEPTDKWTLKQQVLLLQKLGIFELPLIAELSTQNQGKLFAKLLGRSEKNTEDLIRYRKGKNVDPKFRLNTSTNENLVVNLLKEVGIQDSSH